MGTYIFLKDTEGERVPAYRWEDMKGDSLESYRNRVKPGWAIVCVEEEKKKAADVIVEAMQELEKVGIITDFRYDLDGAFPGLEVLRVTETKEKPEPLELTTAEAIEVLETYDQSDDNDDEEFKAAIRKALEVLGKEPKTEHWVHDGGHWKNRWLCSKCGYKLFEERTGFCPNCGAKMEGENADE